MFLQQTVVVNVANFEYSGESHSAFRFQVSVLGGVEGPRGVKYRFLGEVEQL